nr:dirigent protein 22-like [Ipomoea batatas]
MEMKEAIVEVLRKLYEVYSALNAKPSRDVGVTIGDVVPIPNLFTTYSNMVREKGNVEETSNELDIYLMEKIEMPTPNRLGRILDQYRSSLTLYMVEALILTQDWLRSSLQSDAIVSLVQILEETEFMDLLAEGKARVSKQTSSVHRRLGIWIYIIVIIKNKQYSVRLVQLVGRAQGIYTSAAFDEIGLLMVLNFAFVEGKYNGSSLSMVGRNAVVSAVREMPVVGYSDLLAAMLRPRLTHMIPKPAMLSWSTMFMFSITSKP